jgi:methylamine dehydrogenase accessory protein MauD
VHGWWVGSYLVLWALVIVLSLVVVALARQLGAMHAPPGSPRIVGSDHEGPPLDEAAGRDEVSDIRGVPVTVGGPGRRQLLLFVSPGCGVCEQVLPALPALARNGQLAPYVITEIDGTEAELSFGAHAGGVPVISAPELLARLNIPATPYVVVTDRLGVVRGKGALTGTEQLEDLIERALARPVAGGTESQRRPDPSF